MRLAESGKFMSECELVLYAGNFVCNDVLLGRNVFGEEADWVVDHGAALQAAQGTSDRGALAGFFGPGFANPVVIRDQDHRVWVQVQSSVFHQAMVACNKGHEHSGIF